VVDRVLETMILGARTPTRRARRDVGLMAIAEKSRPRAFQ